MIVTLTANSAMDYTVFVDEWQFNRTLRATKTVNSIAGKPTNVSWMLKDIGIDSLALGFRAGRIGEEIMQMLAEKGIQTDFITVEGESRRNLVIVIANGREQTTITSSTLVVTPAHEEQLLLKLRDTLSIASCVVIGGTLPKDITLDFYTRAIRLCNEHHVPVVFDASEPWLKYGLMGSPTYVKPNQEEVSQLVGSEISTLAQAMSAAVSIRDTYHTHPIVTLGSQGALALLDDGAYRIHPINVRISSTAGAGDAVVTGIAASIYRKQPIIEGLRLGFAMATAVITQPGTAQFDAAHIQDYLGQVRIEKIDPAMLEQGQ